MLIVVSPAKTLDYESELNTKLSSKPELLEHSEQLVSIMRTFSALDIAEFMEVSMKIADLNFERFEQWQAPFTKKNARPAALAFRGDVYDGLQADQFNDEELNFLQDHLRILSGLYGFLKPLDLMQPYRLEMGRKLETDRGKNLYEFWGSLVTDALNKTLKKQKSDVLVNLASNEYFKVIRKQELNAEIITPQFKDWKNGQYKMISFYAKKARGMMTRYITENRISDPEEMKNFDLGGYQYRGEMSSVSDWVFTREESA